MPRNRLSDLRDHLFETIEQLKDAENPMDIARAKAIADVAQTIINSATVEVKFMRAADLEKDSEFFGAPGLPPAPSAAPRASAEPAPKGLSTGKNLGVERVA